MLIASIASAAGADTLSTDNGRVAALAHERLMLRRATGADDSLRILFNIFDLAHGRERAAASDRLYEVARRTSNREAVFETTVRRADQHRNDNNVLAPMRQSVVALPYSPDREEVRLFLDMNIVRNNIEALDDSTAINDLADLMSDYITAPPSDAYQKALMLYSICVYLEQATQGELLVYYYNTLIDHLNSMNLRRRGVKNMVYTRAAIALARNDYAGARLELDRHMLAVMDSMERIYRDRGRRYLNYETNRYSTYRRMLSSYRNLPDSLLDLYYGNILQLASENQQIATEMQTYPRARAFYLMGKGRYAEALPDLLAVVDAAQSRPYRRHILEAIVEAASHTGNQRLEIEASRQLNDLLGDNLLQRQRNCTLELSLFNAVTSISEQKSLVENELRRKAERDTRIVFIAGIAVLALLVVLILALLRQLNKARSLARELGNTNQVLRQQKDDLRHMQQELIVARDEAASAERIKSDLMATMTHEVSTPLNSIVEYTRLIVDCIPPDKAQYLDRFTRTIEFNAKLILLLVRDVTDSDAIDRGAITVERLPVSVYQLCSVAINTIFENGHPADKDIDCVFNPSHRPDAYVLTDSYRASQIITNLLANAQKFTEKGTITIDFEPKPGEGVVEFSVTDTGIGVPDGLEDAIFAQFRKVNPSTPGMGLGLYIVRKIATMLGGRVWLDTSYKRGARFRFTLPLAQ